VSIIAITDRGIKAMPEVNKLQDKGWSILLCLEKDIEHGERRSKSFISLFKGEERLMGVGNLVVLS